MNKMQKELEFVNRRFDRDAGVFESIYCDDERGFFKWFNKNFRKPIYERFDIALDTMGDVHGKRIIDVGCGTGIYTTTIGAKGAARVLGVDFSRQMLSLARKKIAQMNLEQVCAVQQINFLDMPTAEKYNFSLAMGVFDYLPDPITFIRKLKAITTDKVIASFPGHSPIREPLRKLRYLFTSRGKVYFYDKADIERIVRAVGFSHYELKPIKTGSGFVLVATP